MTGAAASQWIVRPRPNPRAALRLVCFPYAGAGAHVFRTWPEALPAGVEVLAIALPGRDVRLREPLFHQLSPLVAALTDALASWLEPPFAVFGHSFGAMLGFAFARELHRRGLPGPLHLFASGRRAPQLPERDSLRGLPEPAFLAALRRMGGIPDAVLDEPELIAYFLPILRADFTANESETIAADRPLPCSITALGGVADERVTQDELDAWRAQTTAAFDREMFGGGHFFLQTERAAFLGSLAQRLARITAAL